MDFKISGLDELQRKLDQLAKDVKPGAMAQRMSAVRCPDHGQTPRNVQVVGNEARAEFCCEKLRKLALEAALRPIKGKGR